MLKLLQCEFWKLKRKRFVLFVALGACLFPLPCTALVLKGSTGNLDAFDSMFQMLFCMAMPIMLPCILGLTATMLFYMERDHATLKNLVAIPVSLRKMAAAKVLVLYAMGFLFALVTLLSAMAGGLLAGADLTQVGNKIWIASVTALLYTTGTLPAVAAIVKLNRSYISASIFTFFYTMLGFFLAFTGQFTSQNQVLRVLTSILPTPIIYRWQASRMVGQDTNAFAIWQPYFLDLWIVMLTVLILGAISFYVLMKTYQKQEGQV